MEEQKSPPGGDGAPRSIPEGVDVLLVGAAVGG
jgi:hypothetical protein